MKKLVSLSLLLFTLLLCSNISFGQLTGYSFYKVITIQNGQVAGAVSHIDFPVLINHIDADIRSTGNGGGVENVNGYDIRFTASDGITLLDHQLEDYDPATGSITSWVRIPSLSTSANTIVIMYYGNSVVSINSSVPTVWDNNYKGVWHLNNDEFDGTSNTNDLVAIGTINAPSAAVSGGQSFTFNEKLNGGVQSELQIQGDLTVESWVNFNTLQSGPADNSIMGYGDPALTAPENHSYKLNVTNGNLLRTFWEYGSGSSQTTLSSVVAPVVMGAWHHVAFTKDSAAQNVIFYFDGIQLGVPVAYGNETTGGSNGEIFLGEGFPGFDLDGSIDEARVSDILRSSDWLTTSYNSMNSPVTFYTLGLQVLPPAPAPCCTPGFGATIDFALFTSNGALSNTGTSIVTGDIGSDLGAIAGFGVPSILNGTSYNADAVTAQAKIDLVIAYNQLVAVPCTNCNTHTPSFGSETLTPGVYTVAGAGSLAGALTLDGLGDTNAVFIFRFGGAFAGGAASSIILTNDARYCNIYWVSEGAISLGANTIMKGTMLANNAAVSAAASCDIEGRMLSTTGAIAFGPAIISSRACISPLPPPTWCWAEDAIAAGNEEFLDLATNPVSGISYAVGFFNGDLSPEFTMGFNGTTDMSTPVGAEDGLVVKYDAAGNYIWAFKIGAAGENVQVHSVDLDTAGNFYITGMFTGTVSVQGTATSPVLPPIVSSGGEDMFIAKYDGNGNLIWVSTGAGTNNNIGFDVSVNNSTVFIGGRYRNDITFTGLGSPTLSLVNNMEAYVAAFDINTGNGIWARRITSLDSAKCFGVAANETEVYATGTFQGISANFELPGGPFNLLNYNSGTTDIWVSSYDANTGAVNWAQQIGNTDNDEGNAIAVDPTGVYITGGVDDAGGLVQFPGGVTRSSGNNGFDIFTCKLFLGTGLTDWAFIEQNNTGLAGVGNSIVADGIGNVYITGYFSSSTEFNGGIDLITAIGNEDMFVMNRKDNGLYMWTKVGTDNNNLSGKGLGYDNLGGIYVAGRMESQASFGATPQLNDGGGDDAFIAKITCTVPVCGPSITNCENDTIFNAGATCTIVLGDFTTGITAIDGCGAGLTYTQNPIPGTVLPSGVDTVWLYVTDLIGNVDSCSFMITVSDVTNPTITCPVDLALSTSINSCDTIVTGIAPVAVADNCGIDSVSYVLTGATIASGLNDASGTTFNPGVTTVTYTVTDSSGNTTTCNFTITVTDAVNPTITCPGNIIVSCPGVVNTLAPLASGDNCGVDSVNYVLSGATVLGNGLNDASGNTFNVGVTTVTYTITDLSGNIATCNFTVTVVDIINPTISCPPNLSLGNDPLVCTAVVNGIAPTSFNDNCLIDSVNYVLTGVTTGDGLNDASGTIFNGGITTVTYIVTDMSGNTSSCNFTITVTDIINPTISCPVNVVVNNDAGICGAVITGIVPTTTGDNCGVDSVSYVLSGATILGNGLTDASGLTFNVGVTTITYTVTDLSGNTNSCIATVTVNDIENPTILCPVNVVVNNDVGMCTAVVAGLTTTPADNCGIDSVSYVLTGATVLGNGLNDASGNTFNLGITTVSYTVTDNAGNTNTCNFTVTVVDNEVPIFSCPANINEFVDSNCDFLITDYTGLIVGLNDNCTLNTSIVVSQFPVIGSSISGNGTVQNITLYATDISGNIDSCTFVITLNDTIKPVITCPINISQNTGINCSFTLPNYSPISVGDNCASTAAIIVTQLPIAGTIIFSDTLIMLIADDGNGNTDTCSFMVFLNDSIFPTIICPNDTILNNDLGLCDATITFGIPVNYDNCGVTSLINDFTGTGSSSGTYPVGLTTVTWTINDFASNTTACSFDVTVLDAEEPTIACINDTNINTDVNSCDAVFNYTITAYDNCFYTISQIGGLPSGATFPQGITINTFVATDSVGLADTCSFLVTVTDNQAPSIICPNDIVLCNTSVTIPLPNVGDNCTVSNVMNDFNLSGNASDIYPTGITPINWTVTDANGNFNSCIMTVQVDLNPSVSYAGEDQNVVLNQSTNFEATIPTIGVGTWTLIFGKGTVDDDLNPSSLVSDLALGDNIFRWAIVNGTCPDSFDEVNIILGGLLIPNGFSPNGDNNNDLFVIPGIERMNNEVIIFNRWGIELYHTDNYQNNWNGISNDGSSLPEDTYFYIIKLNDFAKEYSGFVVIKR
jgi:gliding motility-associated-like protein